MPSRYHPIEDGLWDDPKLEGCPFEQKGFFAFLCSNARQRPAGVYRATDGQLAEDTGLPKKRVTAYLVDLCERDLIVRDVAWIFTPGYWKRQAHNPGMVKAARICVESCSSVSILAAFLEHYPLHREWLPNGWQTVRQPSSENARTEQCSTNAEQCRAEHNTSPRQLPEEADWGTPEALAQKYNREGTDNLPAVSAISTKRREKAIRYLRQFPEEAWWTVTFAQYHRSRFLSGKAPPRNGHENFQPDFDWLLSVGKDGTENAVKVHDGRYCDAT
jgi:hypothetical protein